MQIFGEKILVFVVFSVSLCKLLSSKGLSDQKTQNNKAKTKI